MLTGLSAFPLTPMQGGEVVMDSFARIIDRLATSGVDSIAPLGSTGSYAYLDREERRGVVTLAVEHSQGVPVIAGIGATSTGAVQRLADDAQEAGVDAVLLAPVSYQPLSDTEVLGLYRDVTAGLDVPLIVYDNPTTTGVTFTVELLAKIAELPNVAAIKIPPAGDLAQARSHVASLRAALPEHVRIGISGDASAAAGLLAGGDAWFSAAAGTIPQPMLDIARPALAGDLGALDISARSAPLWTLFAEYGSVRVIAALAEDLGYAPADCLPRPLMGLDAASRERVAKFAATVKQE